MAHVWQSGRSAMRPSLLATTSYIRIIENCFQVPDYTESAGCSTYVDHHAGQDFRSVETFAQCKIVNLLRRGKFANTPGFAQPS